MHLEMKDAGITFHVKQKLQGMQQKLQGKETSQNKRNE
jgi:hypothetical protein